MHWIKWEDERDWTENYFASCLKFIALFKCELFVVVIAVCGGLWQIVVLWLCVFVVVIFSRQQHTHTHTHTYKLDNHYMLWSSFSSSQHNHHISIALHTYRKSQHWSLLLSILNAQFATFLWPAYAGVVGEFYNIKFLNLLLVMYVCDVVAGVDVVFFFFAICGKIFFPYFDEILIQPNRVVCRKKEKKIRISFRSAK